MINRYPIWKNLLVLLVITFGVIYALPNIYPPDFAVQISNQDSDGEFTQRALDVATDRLEEEGIEYFGAEIADNSGLIRFNDDEAQLSARDYIQLALHDLPDDYIVALNAAPTTPEWLVSIGAEPMKYGLDLRGGVHFLMEVDTESAIGERLKGLEQDIKRLFRDRDDRIRYQGFEAVENGALEISFANEELRDRAERKLRENYPQHILESSAATPSLRIAMSEDAIRLMEDLQCCRMLRQFATE